MWKIILQHLKRKRASTVANCYSSHFVLAESQHNSTEDTYHLFFTLTFDFSCQHFMGFSKFDFMNICSQRFYSINTQS